MNITSHVATRYKGAEKNFGRFGLIKKGAVLHFAPAEWHKLQLADAHGDFEVISDKESDKSKELKLPPPPDGETEEERAAREQAEAAEREAHAKLQAANADAATLSAQLGTMQKDELIGTAIALREKGVKIEYRKDMSKANLVKAIRDALANQAGQEGAKAS